MGTAIPKRLGLHTVQPWLGGKAETQMTSKEYGHSVSCDMDR